MIYAIVVVLVLIADQATKYLTTLHIAYDAVQPATQEFIPGVLYLTNVHNYGAAFSIFQDARWFLVAVSLIFVIVIIVLTSREIIHTRFGKWMAALVVAGALGNCIDRVLNGYVVDMLAFDFMEFPVFNVADMFITVCGLLFCIHLLLYREPEAVRDANEPEFMRRRRQERAARRSPYDDIPKRGEHKTLEEEMRPLDPDDPFAEWSFGGEAEKGDDAPEDEPPSAPAPEREPPRSGARLGLTPDLGSAPDLGFESDLELELDPEPEPEPEQPSRRRPRALPAPRASLFDEDEPYDDGDDEDEETVGGYRLEDILAEFGDD